MHLTRFQPRIDGERQDFPGRTFGCGQMVTAAQAAAVSRLQVDGHREMDLRGNAMVPQVLPQRISSGRAHDILVIDVRAVFATDRQGDVAVHQSCVVPLGNTSARGVILVEIGEFNTQDGGLQLIQTGVHALHMADIALGPAIFTEQAQPLIEFRVRCHDHAAVAERPQVLGGIETETGQVATRADPLAFVACPMCLRTILDNAQSVSPARLENGIQVHRLTVEMYGNDRSRPGRDGGFNLARIHREIERLDIDKNGDSSGLLNRRHGGNRCMRNGDHFITGPDIAGGQCQVYRIGAAGNADPEVNAGIGGELRLKRLYFLAQDIPATIHHALHGGVDFALSQQILKVRVTATDHDSTPTSGTYTIHLPPARLKSSSLAMISAA